MAATRKLGLIGSFEMRGGLSSTAPERPRRVETPYGEVQATVHMDGLISIRRGKDGLAAHEINHRANVFALASMGVTDVIATAMVGALSRDVSIGDSILLSQFLDFTKRTPGHYYDDATFRDFDFTYPFCPRLRDALTEQASRNDIGLRTDGCYVGVDGPRFETAAEVRMYKRLGGDVVGMTVVNECIMAREAGLCYSTLAGVVNYAAGVDQTPVRAASFLEPGTEHVRKVMALLPGLQAAVDGDVMSTCPCGQSIAVMPSTGARPHSSKDAFNV